MKKIYKLIVLTLICMIVISCFSFVLAKDYEKDLISEQVKNDVYQQYLNDEEFIKFKEEMGDRVAQEFINRVIKHRLESADKIQVYVVPGTQASVNTKVLSQKTDSCCAAASVLTALYAIGYQRYVTGTTDDEKQDTLIQIVPEGTGPVTVAAGLNSYLKNNNLDKYESIAKGHVNMDHKYEFEELVYRTLNSGYAAVLNVSQYKLSYWTDFYDPDAGHYITSYKIDKASHKIWVNDNFDGSRFAGYKYRPTFGTHEISLDEAYGALKRLVYYNE